MKSIGLWHIISFVVMSTLVVTVSTLDKLTFKVVVTRNGTSIHWDKNLADRKSRKFKELALTVKNELQAQLQEASAIKVKKFTNKHGIISCEFECKVNPKIVGKEDIKKVLNGTIDIGANAEVSAYKKTKMRLELSSVPWIGAYNDRNGAEYRNLTSRIEAALSVVFEDTDDVLGFEIISLSRATDGSVVVEYLVLVNPDSELKKADLDETLNEFKKNSSFGGMTTEKQTAIQEQENESKNGQKDGSVIALVVIGVLLMCLVMIAFLVRVLWLNWKNRPDSPEDLFESYKKRDKIASMTALEKTNSYSTMTTLYISGEDVVLHVHDSKL